MWRSQARSARLFLACEFRGKKSHGPGCSFVNEQTVDGKAMVIFHGVIMLVLRMTMSKILESLSSMVCGNLLIVGALSSLFSGINCNSSSLVDCLELNLLCYELQHCVELELLFLKLELLF